ncbi:Hepatocyte growth factor receptor, partial [Geodia barretti]
MSNSSEKECKHGEVRLVGGVTNSTGRLEFCANGVWGRICNKLEYWGPENARVVCRQLGFSEKGAYILDYEDRFGTSNRAAVIGEVYCNGTEPELLECFHASIGSHRCYRGRYVTDIIISCYDENRGCENGEVRLQGGAGSSNGHVEFCKDRVWGRVCSDGWDMNDTMVVCRQLGFEPEDSAVIPGPANAGDVPVFLGQVNCSGTEQYFNECSHGRPPPADCARAAISCKTNSNETKCAAQTETSTYPASYGECSVYKSETGVCDDVVRPDIDKVYASYRLGDQSTIAQLLHNNIKDNGTDQNEYCMKQVLRALCHFYLPPCGNSTHLAPPSSICQEQCQMVQETCHTTWSTLLSAFDSVDLVIECNDTSALLFPVPHCCTDAGLGRSAVHLLPSSTVGITPEISSLPHESKGAVVEIVITVVGLFLLAAVAMIIVVSLLVVLSSKRRRRKRLENMQLDILAIGGRGGAPVSVSVTEEMEPGEKGDANASVAGPNPYMSTGLNTGLLQVPWPRTRVPSHHMRELARGKFLVKSEDITLLDSIGEGEFGVVYKARLGLSKRVVAVKTLKGEFVQVEVDKFVEESLKMSRFKHGHVMGLIGVCLDAGSAPYIIMPYMANGSLLKYLKRERNNIVVLDETDEDELGEVRKRLMVICSQIASGMEYLAANKYVHRDLAARNCMIDAHFVIKITDFGLSEDVFERNYFRQDSSSGEVVKLPIKWMSPESLSDGHFSEKSDVWSYGVTMWEIFSGGKAPYPGTNPLTLMESLEQGYRMPQPYNDACSEAM